MILVIVEKERHSQSHHIADKKRDLIFSYKLWKTYAVHKRLFTFQWPCLGGLVLYMFFSRRSDRLESDHRGALVIWSSGHLIQLPLRKNKNSSGSCRLILHCNFRLCSALSKKRLLLFFNHGCIVFVWYIILIILIS